MDLESLRKIEVGKTQEFKTFAEEIDESPPKSFYLYNKLNISWLSLFVPVFLLSLHSHNYKKMFKKSTTNYSKNLFFSNDNTLSKQALKKYNDSNSWHNLFRLQVINRIDESEYKVLFSNTNGSPNSPIRIMLGMMILKEGLGISDEKIFEDLNFNLLTKSALGLFNLDDPVPVPSTYYLFRKRVNDYATKTGINLFEQTFSQITKDQCVAFNVLGERIRMDSKLISSNIAWLGRYEIVHSTLELFFREIENNIILDSSLKVEIKNNLKISGYKTVYSSTSDQIKDKFKSIGKIICRLISDFEGKIDLEIFATLKQVFLEQYNIDNNNDISQKSNKEIKATSIQSPHDIDSTYRNKNGQKVKGSSLNITETCDDGSTLNLITSVEVKNANSSDTGFLKQGIEKSKEITRTKPKKVHADGGYNSKINQKYCNIEEIALCLHAIQGRKGRFEFKTKEGVLIQIFDTVTNQIVDFKKIETKSGEIKWRIKANKNYRYFKKSDIETFKIREGIKNEDYKELQKRNNVEATVFQVSYHCSGNKLKYRRLIKTQMWANLRCAWVNFIRISKFRAPRKKIATICCAIPKFIYSKIENTVNFFKNLISDEIYVLFLEFKI